MIGAIIIPLMIYALYFLMGPKIAVVLVAMMMVILSLREEL